MQPILKPSVPEHSYSHKWQEPLEVAAGFAEQDFCLLYSGFSENKTGRYSYLCLQPEDVIEATDISALKAIKPNEKWFGYIGYEAAHGIETFPKTNPPPIAMPTIRFIRYANIIEFDHQKKCIKTIKNIESAAVESPNEKSIKLLNIHSNMSKDSYLESIQSTKEKIQKGAFYQANITRKFFGEWQCESTYNLFTKLCTASPAPYSAYIQHSGQAIISSSPEQFIHVDKNRTLSSRPIKGTLQAEMPSEHLRNSDKDKAENLMIVDLMRNDLSRVCKQGTVQVDDLYSIRSYQTLHHMVSTITGQLETGINSLDVLNATFPPGSMTGAPKVAAMRWCAEQEKMDRGVYSGAIGWIDGSGQMELSVVIRTLIATHSQFEFQVGGGIVADSDPIQEWQETLTKARGICAALGISTDKLAKL